MTEAKHTPTPWEAHQCGVYRDQLRKPGDPWENPIACTGDDPDPELGETALERQQIADAAFIVRACNSYPAFEKMKEALVTISQWKDVRSKLAYEHAVYLLDVIDAVTDLATAALDAAEADEKKGE